MTTTERSQYCSGMASTQSKAQSSFAAYVAEIMSPLGEVTTRAMFGGYNVAIDGLTFGLIVNGVLYLKADDVNRPAFDKAGLRAFTYHAKGGKKTAMSYFEAPDCIDDWEALEPWADGALAAAKRAKVSAPKKAPAKKGTAKPAPAKKAHAKPAPAKKASAKKAPAKKAVATKRTKARR